MSNPLGEFRIELWEKRVLIRHGRSHSEVASSIKRQIAYDASKQGKQLFLHSIEEITEDVPKEMQGVRKD